MKDCGVLCTVVTGNVIGFAAVKMFVQLDQIDQTKITTRMEVMLEDEKYALKKESKHA